MTTQAPAADAAGDEHPFADTPYVTAAASDVDHPPRPLTQRLGAILWPAFVAAGIATMVFFAFVDPIELATISVPDLHVGRELGYTVGFFMFWGVTTLSSFFTWVLLRPASRFNQGAKTHREQATTSGTQA